MTSGSDQPRATTRVRLVDDSEDVGWWARYECVLKGRISPTSLRVLGQDAEFIVDRCVLAADRGGAASWGASRERSGAVMGAVQSGKTASMLAVIAKAIDGGVDAVVVLAGTRTALWLQTWERLRAQLDTFPDRRSRRLMLPSFDPADVAEGSFSLSSLYAMTPQLAASAVARRTPIIAVVLKQVDHLQRLANTLHDVVYPLVDAAGRPFHLLVLDDEADDSSIGEQDLSDGSSLQERQVPRRIVDLWESRQQGGSTVIPGLRATYLAYTATPQANFLQEESNPLAPRDFVVCLRTPGADGDPDGRDPSYRVAGVKAWYTGGDVYYKTLAHLPLCVPVDDLPETERLLHGIRGYLVASAIRLLRSPGSTGPRAAHGEVFASREEAEVAGGPVTSMLVHPSAVKDAHFETAGKILAWAAGVDVSEGPRLLAEDDRVLQTTGVLADMEAHPDKWVHWLADFDRSLVEASKLPGGSGTEPHPGWGVLRSVILEEIVPGTSVAVINSDERADDRPVFEPVADGVGWIAAPNLSTIFVSGNVMSRGLTLEGLSTTVFTRSSEDPAADTQMQMQRWFGYRGKYIDVCRVLASAAQISLFQQYHETDLALRTQILNAMSAGEPARPAVLQGREFKATGKIRGVAGRALWPGADPFTSVVNVPDLDGPNQQVVADVFQEDSSGVPDSSGRQGRLLDRTLSLSETADLLDSLRYPAGGDGGRDPAAESRWAAVEQIARVALRDERYPVFRMPKDTHPELWGADSPFNIAAYLRFWALCLESHVPAVFSTDEPPLIWSLLDLRSRAAEQPRFRIGLRFGSGAPVSKGPLSEMPWPVTTMQRNVVESRVRGGWGSRNFRDGVMWGDEFFDCYTSGVLPRLTPSRARERGSDGLLLFHVVEGPGGVVIAPGLSIPVGGPDQVHADARRIDGS